MDSELNALEQKLAKARDLKQGMMQQLLTGRIRLPLLKWFTEFGHLNRGDMLTSEQHRCHNEKKKFQRRV